MATIAEIIGTDLLHKKDYAKKSDSGDLATLSGLENLKEALFRRLITEPGSIIHRPTYGVGIKRFQNAPATMATKRALALRINEQFPQDPRVEEVLGVSMESSDYSPEKTVVTVRVKVVGYGEAKMEFVPFSEVP